MCIIHVSMYVTASRASAARRFASAVARCAGVIVGAVGVGTAAAGDAFTLPSSTFVSAAAPTATPPPSVDEGEKEVGGMELRSVRGARIEGAEARNRGEAAKIAATLTRRAATPSGAFKPKEFIVQSEPPTETHTWTYWTSIN